MIQKNITNRNGKNIVALIEGSEEDKETVILMHGLGRSKEDVLLTNIANTYKEHGYTTVRFDATNAEGESEGNPKDATVANHYEDFEDVLAWAKTQGLLKKPYTLVGHSVGGLCAMLFAQKDPEDIKALTTISGVVSGDLALKAYPQELLNSWKQKGVCEWEEKGKLKSVKWKCIEEWPRFNALESADALTMPILMLVGENDSQTPPKHQRILYERIPGKKELHVIQGAPHAIEEKEHIQEVERIIQRWIQEISS